MDHYNNSHLERLLRKCGNVCRMTGSARKNLMKWLLGSAQILNSDLKMELHPFNVTL